MTIVEIRLNIIGKKPYPFYQGVVETLLPIIEKLEEWGNFFRPNMEKILGMSADKM